MRDTKVAYKLLVLNVLYGGYNNGLICSERSNQDFIGKHQTDIWPH